MYRIPTPTNRPYLAGADPESGKMNGGESYDLTIIAAVIGVVVLIIVFVGIGVKVVVSRNNTKKVRNLINCSFFL